MHSQLPVGEEEQKTGKRKLIKLPYVDSLELIYRLENRYGERIHGTFVLDLFMQKHVEIEESAMQWQHIDLHIENVNKTLRNISIVRFSINSPWCSLEKGSMEFEFVMFPEQECGIVRVG